MTAEEQAKIIDNVFRKVRALRETKGVEYAGSEDTLADFKEVAAQTGTTPFQVWAVYVKKHQRAIDSYILAPGEAKSEPIESRIVDVIVYHCLLLGLIEDAHQWLPNPQVTITDVSGGTAGEPRVVSPMSEQRETRRRIQTNQAQTDDERHQGLSDPMG